MLSRSILIVRTSKSSKKNLFCKNCGKTEIQLSNKKLYKKTSGYLCHDCLYEKLKKANENPSNSEKKYYLDYHNLKWELEKVKIACLGCQKKRWLLSSNSWKKYCISCYSSNKRNFSTSISSRFNKEKTIISTQTVLHPTIYQPKVMNKNLSLISTCFTVGMILLKKIKR